MSYSWGSDTSSSSRSGGYNYGSARKAYSGRAYAPQKKSTSSSSGGSSSRKRTYSPTQRTSYDNSAKGKDFKTETDAPIVVAMDVTGSMGEYINIFFDKLPLLWEPNEGVTKYFPKAELSFAAIGDHYDSRPIQVAEFGKGTDLDGRVSSFQTQGGAGNGTEAYETTAHFYSNHCEMPKAKAPMFFWLVDEAIVETADSSTIEECIGDTLTETKSGKEAMQELASKFDVYVLRKSTAGGYGSAHNAKAMKQWQDIYGVEKVMMLDEPKRVVDCILGLVANKAGQFDVYQKLLSGRQTQQQVGQVMSSIKNATKTGAGYQAKSNKKLPSGSKQSKKLGS